MKFFRIPACSLFTFSMMLSICFMFVSAAPCLADELALSFADSENATVTIISDKDIEFSSFKVNNPYRLVIDVKNISAPPAEYLNKHRQIPKVQVNRLGSASRIILEPVAGIQLLTRQDSPRSITVLGAAQATYDMAAAARPFAADTAPQETRTGASGGAVTSRGHVASVTVEHKPDTTRITLNISGNCVISDPLEVINGISVSFANCIIPANWQGTVDAARDNPVVSAVTLFPANAAKKIDTGMLIELHQRTRFSFSKNRQRLVIDVEMAGAALTAAPSTRDSLLPKSSAASLKPADATSDAKADTKKYSGKKVSMEFDNAEIRHVFRLLAEISGENFVINDEVKGTFSIKLKDVPWEQALEIIVKNNNLAVEHIGNVIEILPRQKKIERDKAENDLKMQEIRQKLEEKMAKESAEGMATRTIQLKHVSAIKMAESLIIMLTQGNASVSTGQGQQQGQQLTQGQASSSVKSDIQQSFSALIQPEPNTNKIIVRDYISKIDAIEKLVYELDVPERQVMIEARIVVATSEFTRDFGIQWGVHLRDGSASFLGINSMDTGFGGVATAPPSLGQFSGSSGINTGISFGTLASNIQLDMRLSAATAANTVKVIASPRIVTLNNEAAKIEQGQSTFVQTIDKLGVPNMTSVTATLKLDVTPSIKSNDNITLKIDASDDSFGLPPPGASSVAINKRTASSKILLRDGETVVIGGIFREENSDDNSGVPYLKDIPLLGHLFKSSRIFNKRNELLIFITPRVINRI